MVYVLGNSIYYGTASKVYLKSVRTGECAFKKCKEIESDVWQFMCMTYDILWNTWTWRKFSIETTALSHLYTMVLVLDTSDVINMCVSANCEFSVELNGNKTHVSVKELLSLLANTEEVRDIEDIPLGQTTIQQPLYAWRNIDVRNNEVVLILARMDGIRPTLVKGTLIRIDCRKNLKGIKDTVWGIRLSRENANPCGILAYGDSTTNEYGVLCGAM